MRLCFGLQWRWLRAVAVSGVVGLVVLLGATASDARESAQARPKPTVVLVHGAFADASSWSPVVSRLQRAGYPVVAPANPLRGLASDAAYVSSFLETLSGPLVLVGHSYGGAVITNAAVQHANVTALVYIAAYIPDTGQALKDLTPLPGTLLVPSALVLRPWTLADGSTGVDVSIDPRQFRTIFAADLPEEQTAVMAASQRPLSAQALFEPSAAAAWQTIPSWALVATQDNAIGTANVRAMAQHAHAHIVEVAGSHAVLLSRPDAVVRLIRAAARNDD